MILTKPQFTQKWQHSESLAKHAWRCYLNRPDVTVDMMSKPSYAAWVACNTVWDKLNPAEQALVREFHAIRFSPDGSGVSLDDHVGQLAQEKHVPPDYVWTTIKNVWRMWAIERGLADE